MANPWPDRCYCFWIVKDSCMSFYPFFLITSRCFAAECLLGMPFLVQLSTNSATKRQCRTDLMHVKNFSSPTDFDSSTTLRPAISKV